MPNFSIPDGAARGLIVPPNETIAAGGGASHSYLPLARHASAAGPFLSGAVADHLGATADFQAPEAPIQVPDQRFDAAASAMPQPPCAVEPGKGAVPVEPFDARERPERFGPLLNASWPPAGSGSD